jgi:AcrR family transcriptional regulator
MADVAREMRVSQGTLYNYVESKEALFYLLVERGVSNEPVTLPDQLPLPTPSRETLLRRLEEQMRHTFVLPELDRALKRRRVSDARAELEGVVREFYAFSEKTRRVADVIERSALDLPDFFALFFLKLRRNHFARVAAYVERRVRLGHFRHVPDAAVAARFLIETITFFARHRHRDPDPTPMDEDLVRETTVRLLVNTLIKEDRA